MNKTQLVQHLVLRTALTPEVVRKVLDALFEADGVLQGELVAGRAVAIRGFGTFEPRTKAPRLVRNPQGGKPIQLPATQVAAFKPAEALRERMRG